MVSTTKFNSSSSSSSSYICNINSTLVQRSICRDLSHFIEGQDMVTSKGTYGLWLVTFVQLDHFSYDLNTWLVQDAKQLNQGCTHNSSKSSKLYEYLKVSIKVDSLPPPQKKKDHKGVSESCWLLNLKLLTNLSTWSKFFKTHVFFWCLFVVNLPILNPPCLDWPSQRHDLYDVELTSIMLTYQQYIDLPLS